MRMYKHVHATQKYAMTTMYVSYEVHGMSRTVSFGKLEHNRTVRVCELHGLALLKEFKELRTFELS